jgi:hypothetical protein
MLMRTEGKGDEYFLVNHVEESVAVMNDLAGIEGSPVTSAPPPASPIWLGPFGKWSPIVLSLSTAFFLYLAIARGSVTAWIFVVFGISYIALWAASGMRRRRLLNADSGHPETKGSAS